MRPTHHAQTVYAAIHQPSPLPTLARYWLSGSQRPASREAVTQSGPTSHAPLATAGAHRPRHCYSRELLQGSSTLAEASERLLQSRARPAQPAAPVHGSLSLPISRHHAQATPSPCTRPPCPLPALQVRTRQHQLERAPLLADDQVGDLAVLVPLAAQPQPPQPAHRRLAQVQHARVDCGSQAGRQKASAIVQQAMCTGDSEKGRSHRGGCLPAAPLLH